MRSSEGICRSVAWLNRWYDSDMSTSRRKVLIGRGFVQVKARQSRQRERESTTPVGSDGKRGREQEHSGQKNDTREREWKRKG